MPSEVAAGGTLVGFDISADGNRIVFGRADLSSPVALFATRAEGTGAQALDSPNRDLLSRVAPGATREITIKGWGGEPVQI